MSQSYSREENANSREEAGDCSADVEDIWLGGRACNPQVTSLVDPVERDRNRMSKYQIVCEHLAAARVLGSPDKRVETTHRQGMNAE